MVDLPPPEVLSVDQVTVVAPGPEYEHIYENMLESFEGLIEVGKTAEPPLLLIDLGHTRHVGSAFLGFLMRLSQTILDRDGGRFGVCCPTPFCLTVIKTMRMDKVWEIFKTRDAAVEAFTTEQ